MQFYSWDVRSVDGAVCIHVAAEISIGYRRTALDFCRTHVAGVDTAVTRCVTQKDAHRNNYAVHVHAVGDIVESNGNRLSIRHIREIDGERIRPASSGGTKVRRQKAEGRIKNSSLAKNFDSRRCRSLPASKASWFEAKKGLPVDVGEIERTGPKP
jgi:hypothetical protein